MIKALQREKFVVQDTVSGRYGLGPTIMTLARILLQRSDQDELAVVAIPHLERMRALTGETVGLHLPMGELRLCVVELVSREPMRTATGVGRTFALPAGAAGKILVAWSDERLEIVEEHSAASQRVRRELRRTLSEVREHGYATSFGETIPGASAVALPVVGPNGDVRAAVNITGPSGRWTLDRMLSNLDLLVAEVAHISGQLGHRIEDPD